MWLCTCRRHGLSLSLSLFGTLGPILFWTHICGESTTMSLPFSLPPAAFTLITDELSAPADFLFHQAVNNWLKGHRSTGPVAKKDGSVFTEVLVLSATEDTGRWKAIASKSVRLSNPRMNAYLEVYSTARVLTCRNTSQLDWLNL